MECPLPEPMGHVSSLSGLLTVSVSNVGGGPTSSRSLHELGDLIAIFGCPIKWPLIKQSLRSGYLLARQVYFHCSNRLEFKRLAFQQERLTCFTKACAVG